jgi:hypothetical protein
MSISVCSIQPVPGLRCLAALAWGYQRCERGVREDFLVQLRPASNAAAGHSQVDQVPGVLAQRPWALVVAWYTKSQVRGDSARAGSVSGQKMQGRAAYFSGWMLTRSNPRTCRVCVSRLAAMRQFFVGAPRHSGICCTGAVSLAARKLHCGTNLLGHINRPDTRPTAHIEDAGLQVWLYRHGRLVQRVSPCDGKQFMVDIHAVLLGLLRVSQERAVGFAPAYLVARIHVDASPVAMVPAAVLQVVAVLSGHGQSG